MSAEIIQFGKPRIPAQSRIGVSEPTVREGKVLFQFEGQEYEALFHGGELYWIYRRVIERNPAVAASQGWSFNAQHGGAT